MRDPMISDEEFHQLKELCILAASISRRNATRFKIGEPVKEPAVPASYFGHINILPLNKKWPRYKRTPMLPLMQLRLSECPSIPDSLTNVEYLLVFCGIDSDLDIPTELFDEFFELSQKWNAKFLARAFYKRNASKIHTVHSANLDRVLVIPVPKGTPTSEVESQDQHSILRPHSIEIESFIDIICTTESRHMDLHQANDKSVVNELTQHRRWTQAQHQVIEDVFQNYKGSKLGGWPTGIQHYIDFDGEADFVLQIASNKELGLMMGDLGILYIGYNTKKKTWVSDWSCY